MIARNTTVTSSGQVQNSPRWELGGRAFVSGADTPFAIYMWLVPSTGGTYRWNFSRLIGVTESTVGYFTNSTPGQFVGAFVSQSGFAALTNGGFFFDSDNSGMFRSGSGGLQLLNRATGDPLLLRSPVTPGTTAAVRIYANAGNWSASQIIVEIGDDNGSGTFVKVLGVAGDGVAEGPEFHIVATVYTNAAPLALATAYNSYKIDLSGGDVAIGLPAPTGSGAAIEFCQTVGGNNNMVFTPVSGAVEGGASFSATGHSLAPFHVVVLRDIGGTIGWKVVVQVT